MSAAKKRDYTPELRQMMEPLGVSSFLGLARKAGVSEHQVRSLRRGQVAKMRLETLLSLARALEVSLEQLLATFSEIEVTGDNREVANLDNLQAEYDRLQKQLETQQEEAIEQFQQTSLDTLESWMIFWPAAAYAARQNPDFEATKLLRLVKPVEQLLQQWGVETIGEVGMEVPYDPQQHQLIKGSAEPGQMVTVRNVGYRLGKRLLHRVKASVSQN
ncbi:MAG: nucleotide exchange factor GrpE [Cyanobacteriota bacterium]|nr:nucleotide exchange factor GrpE [Cyanobacteriota bacterium]